MSEFELIEIKSESGKDYYVQGYVSTTDPDFVNDIVDEDGQKATFREISNKKITMDEDHNEWRNPKTGKLYDGKKNKFPLAKVVETKLDSKGTWVKAKLNKFHPDFEDKILPMIKEKYLHSFSIAYTVKDYVIKVINNVKYRIIKNLKIANIAITGNPINQSATFSLTLKSSLKMVDENIKQTENTSEIDSNTEYKSMDYKERYEEMKAKYEETNKQLKTYLDKENSKDDNKEMKSFMEKFESLENSVQSLKTENAELKSFIESPQLKSIVEGKSKAPKTTENETVSMWSIM